VKTACLLLVVLGCSAVRADIWTYFSVTCDARKMTVTISERDVEDVNVKSNAKDLTSISSLGKIQTIPTPAGPKDIFVKQKTFRKTCDLGGSRYVIEVAPWKWNPVINGMCGGGDPSVQLSAWRNRQRIVKDLIFDGYCNPPETNTAVTGVLLSESRQLVTIHTIDPSSIDEAPQLRRYPYSESAHIQRSEIRRAVSKRGP
jgi:hypothetical protein